MASRHRGPSQRLFWRDAKTSARDARVPRQIPATTSNRWLRHNKLPPTFSRGRLVPAIADAASTARILLFREEVFSSRHAGDDPRSTIAATTPARMRWRQANILASG